MKSLNNNFRLIIAILIVVSLILITEVKSKVTREKRNTKVKDEKKIFNDTLLRYNKTESKFQDLSKDLQKVKYNYFLLKKYRRLMKLREEFGEELEKVRDKIDSNVYEKDSILEQIEELNKKLDKYDAKCSSTSESYKNAEYFKNVMINMVKIFFITIFGTIALSLGIAGVILLVTWGKKDEPGYDEDESSLEYLNSERSSLKKLKKGKKKKGLKKTKVEKAEKQS